VLSSLRSEGLVDFPSATTWASSSHLLSNWRTVFSDGSVEEALNALASWVRAERARSDLRSLPIDGKGVDPFGEDVGDLNRLGVPMVAPPAVSHLLRFDPGKWIAFWMYCCPGWREVEAESSLL
jgi:hypothetical protein